MSGIDFKSFLIGVLITIIFVFTTGISVGSHGKYTVSCQQQYCFTLNAETGVGRYVRPSMSQVDWLLHGMKPDF